MKNILTLILTLSIFTASAQYAASVQKGKDSKNNICAERGHNLIYPKNVTARVPYTIDTKDSTVTVYPFPHAIGKCSRCGAEVETYDKDIRVTTWRRTESQNYVGENETDWGVNSQRALNKSFKSTNLSDVKKVATLKNDTLFIHKRIAPFANLKEQIKKPTTVYYKNYPITFKAAVFDDAAFYAGKNGLEFF